MTSPQRQAFSAFGYWWDPADADEKITGQLSWEQLRTPRLSLLDPPQGLWNRSPEPSGTVVPLLNGRLAGQGAVTLLDAVWGGLSLGATHTQKLLVETVMIGVWLDASDEPFIRRLEIRWSDLRALLGGFVKLRRSPPTGASEITFDLDLRRHIWDDGDVTVVFHSDLRYLTDAISADVRIHPTVLLASYEPRSYDWWRKQWLVPLNNLLTIATGIQVNPQSIHCWEQKDPIKDEHLTKRVEVFGRGVGERVTDLPKPVALITADDIDRSDCGIHNVIAGLRQLQQQHPTFLDLLLDVINYPERPLRNRYLDIVSSLEAYHTETHGIGPIDKMTYKGQRKAAILAAKEAGLPTSDVKFLKDWLSTYSFFSLEKRLRAIERELSSPPKRTISAQRMAQIRNLVAHGNAHLKDAELQGAYDRAFELARQTVLHAVGLE